MYSVQIIQTIPNEVEFAFIIKSLSLFELNLPYFKEALLLEMNFNKKR